MRIRLVVLAFVLAAVIFSGSVVSAAAGDADGTAQSGAAAAAPLDASDRIFWVAEGSVGPRSLAAGVIVDTWQTGWNTPEEWGRSWSGIGKRFAAREAGITISNGVEAGVGALWDEDPRYARAGDGAISTRIGHALKLAVMARHRDGRLTPAWARYTGNVFSNVLQNTWLPPSVTTTRMTAMRIGNGVLGRFAGNLFSEFWPDIKQLRH